MNQQAAGSQQSSTVHQKVEQVLDLIRPAIQDDGGDVELVDVTDQGIVMIRMLGACIGCPSSEMTLQMGIEKNLKDRIPEVVAVQQV